MKSKVSTLRKKLTHGQFWFSCLRSRFFQQWRHTFNKKKKTRKLARRLSGRTKEKKGVLEGWAGGFFVFLLFRYIEFKSKYLKVILIISLALEMLFLFFLWRLLILSMIMIAMGHSQRNVSKYHTTHQWSIPSRGRTICIEVHFGSIASANVCIVFLWEEVKEK